MWYGSVFADTVRRGRAIGLPTVFAESTASQLPATTAVIFFPSFYNGSDLPPYDMAAVRRGEK